LSLAVITAKDNVLSLMFMVDFYSVYDICFIKSTLYYKATKRIGQDKIRHTACGIRDAVTQSIIFFQSLQT
jgi:hypothetical protein